MKTLRRRKEQDEKEASRVLLERLVLGLEPMKKNTTTLPSGSPMKPQAIDKA